MIELLVTIAILIVLAALAFMGASGARRRAEMVVAVNRIKGINYANTLYAGDHGGRYCPIYNFDEDSKGAVHWHFNPELLKHVIGETDLEFLEQWEEHEGVSGIPEELLDPIVVRAKKNTGTAFRPVSATTTRTCRAATLEARTPPAPTPSARP